MSAETFVVDEEGQRVDMQFFVVRPPVFCAMCSQPVLQHLWPHDVTRREVWCANSQCSQHSKRVIMRDPIARGTPLPSNGH